MICLMVSLLPIKPPRVRAVSSWTRIIASRAVIFINNRLAAQALRVAAKTK
jgi:hypothetical protein